MHIAITGNIGAGKTTLTTMLSEHYQWEAYFEPVESNPFLKDFYADMHRWSFHVQVYFLGSRFKQMLNINQIPHHLFQDRTIYEDAYIFARNLYNSGFMSKREYDTYLQLFESMLRVVRPPDLIIYLRTDLEKLLRQIKKRARDYETGISREYLQNLNTNYESWLSTYTYSRLLVIDMSQIDFVTNPDDFKFITNKIDQEIELLSEKR